MNMCTAKVVTGGTSGKITVAVAGSSFQVVAVAQPNGYVEGDVVLILLPDWNGLAYAVGVVQ